MQVVDEDVAGEGGEDDTPEPDQSDKSSDDGVDGEDGDGREDDVSRPMVKAPPHEHSKHKSAQVASSSQLAISQKVSQPVSQAKRLLKKRNIEKSGGTQPPKDDKIPLPHERAIIHKLQPDARMSEKCVLLSSVKNPTVSPNIVQ